jgi:hypothetical protein
MILRRLDRNSEPKASIESGPYTLQYVPNIHLTFRTEKWLGLSKQTRKEVTGHSFGLDGLPNLAVMLLPIREFCFQEYHCSYSFSNQASPFLLSYLQCNISTYEPNITGQSDRHCSKRLTYSQLPHFGRHNLHLH